VPARLVLSAILGAIVTGAAIGLIRCLLDGETVARMIEKGWLVAAAVALAGAIRELWDRRQAGLNAGGCHAAWRHGRSRSSSDRDTRKPAG
jgi:hypothetical protein